MAKDSGNRIPALDGLRAISIAFVLIGHMIGSHGAPKVNWPGWFGIAELGVGIFFVISGYLITTLLLNERQQTSKISLKQFYIRRSYRILPAAYVYMGVITVLWLLGSVPLQHHDLLHAATYTTNFHIDRGWWLGHLWSLSVEEQFYLLWPALVVLMSTRGAMWAAVIGIGLAPISRVVIWVFFKAHAHGIGEYFPTICDGLATGCLLAIVRPKLGQWKPYMAFLGSPLFWVVPPGAIAAMYVLHWPPLRLTILPVVINTSIALLIDRCLRFPDRRFVAVMDWAPVAWVGTLSYSLYLWQQPFINRHSDAWLNRFPIYLPLAFAAAIISHHAVEKPMLRLRARRARAKAQLPSVPPVPVQAAS